MNPFGFLGAGVGVTSVEVVEIELCGNPNNLMKICEDFCGVYAVTADD